MGEWVRWMVALTVYPFLWLDDKLSGRDEDYDRVIEAQRARLQRLADNDI